VQGTAQCHHEITDALLPQANPVFDDATALHTAVDVLDAEPARVECLISQVLLPRQRFPLLTLQPLSSSQPTTLEAVDVSLKIKEGGRHG
jgi:hypothetical protein